MSNYKSYRVGQKDIVAFKKFSNDEMSIIDFNKEAPSWEAHMASILIEKWGLVAAIPDGEDSAGRSKLRMQTPQEIVDRACETASLAVARFRSSGWVVQAPSYDEMHKALYENEDADE